MIYLPKTRDQAEKYRYNRWAGNPEGHAYSPKYCAFSVSCGGRSMMMGQCRRRSGHGPDKLYCRQHAMKVEPDAAETVTAWKVDKGYEKFAIAGVPVAKMTDKSVTLPDGRREGRSSQWQRYFKTKQEAAAWVDGQLREKIAVAKKTIASCEAQLATLEQPNAREE